MSKKLFKKSTLLRLDRGISLLYILVFAILFLSFGCDSKPPEHGSSTDLNIFLVKHFQKNKEEFYEMANFFLQDPVLYEIQGDWWIGQRIQQDDGRYVIDKYESSLLNSKKDELKRVLDSIQTQWVKRADNNEIVFYEAKTHEHIDDQTEIKRSSVFVYTEKDLLKEYSLCPEFDNLYKKIGSCVLKLDSNFYISHQWRTKSYEKN